MVLLVWDQKHRVPDKKDPKRPTPRHIIIKMPNGKDKEMEEGVKEWVRGEGIKKYK